MRGLIAFWLLTVAALAGAQSQIVAQLLDGSTAGAVALDHGIGLLDVTSGAPFALFEVPVGIDPLLMQAELRTDPRVAWAEDNIELSDPEGQSAIKGSTIPAIGDRFALYAKNTHVLEQINFSQALSLTPGRTVRIAILDTGLSPFYKYLSRKIDAAENFIEADGRFPYDLPQYQDSNGNGFPDEAVGHGTMIAGIIDQVAPQVRFLIARVADSDGNASAWTIIKGLAFAVVNGAEVANVSLGSINPIPALTDVLDWCELNRLLVVSGIGNANIDRAFYPARITKVVCVTGLDPDNLKAAFSNWDNRSRSAAPATGIVSQWWTGRMGIWSGTSFSSPMVAAAVADCLRRKANNLPLDFIRDTIQLSGRDINALNPNYSGKLGTLLDIQQLDALLGGGRRKR